MNLRNRRLIPSFQRPPSRVLIRRVADYQRDLEVLIGESIMEFRLTIQGKTVLLKPNLVGLDPLGVMNTHPAVISAARTSFLRLGAARVLIGDGPAMDRDTHAILESVRLREFTGKLPSRLARLPAEAQGAAQFGGGQRNDHAVQRRADGAKGPRG